MCGLIGETNPGVVGGTDWFGESPRHGASERCCVHSKRDFFSSSEDDLLRSVVASHWALRTSGQCEMVCGVHSGAGKGADVEVEGQEVEGVVGPDGVEPGQGCAP